MADDSLSQLLAPSVVIAKRYVLLDRVGEGGMGEVWRAHDQVTQTAVALKMLRPSIAGAPAAEIRFQREIQAMARLVHPHIVPILDAGTDPKVGLFFVMTLQLGLPLYKVAKKWTCWRDMWPIVSQILDTLAYAHSHEVIHRDIKPDNILVDSNNQAVLLDFGVARLKDHVRSGTSAYDMLGTVDYAAPEQGAGTRRRIGPWTDIYCFAIVLFEIICGRLPFWAPSPVQSLMLRMNQGCPPLEPRAGFAIPRGLQAVFDRMMHPDPFQRFNHAASVRNAFAALENEPQDVVGMVLMPDMTETPSGVPVVSDEVSTANSMNEAEILFRKRLSSITVGVESSSISASFESPLRQAEIKGREFLLGKLRRAVDRWRQAPRPGVLAVVGEAGLGKTRLAREALYPALAAAEIDSHRHRWRVEPSVREIALSICGAVGLKPKVFSDHLQWWLHGHGVTDCAIQEQLIDWIMAPPGPTTVEREGGNLALVLRAACGAARDNHQQKPFVLLLDDLKTLDPVVLTVVWAVHRYELPVLVLITTRSIEIVPHLPRPRWLETGTRTLTPLNEEEMGQILDELLLCNDMKLRRSMILQSQGNPGRLLMCMQHLRRQGLLLPAYPKWMVTPHEWRNHFKPHLDFETAAHNPPTPFI